MSSITFSAEPAERAILRWVLKARGNDPRHGGLIATPGFPQGTEFACFDGYRLHRWTRQAAVPGIPLLGCAFAPPDLSKMEGVDALTLTPDPALAIVQFAGLAGKAMCVSAAVTIEDARGFREQMTEILGAFRKDKAEWVVISLPDGIVSYREREATFKVSQGDGVASFAIDPDMLRDAIPFVPTARRKQALYLGANDKSMILATGQQMAVVALKVSAPDEPDQKAA